MHREGPSRVEDLFTPSLIVDLDVFEANVAACFERLSRVAVRPHMKTAKSPAVAELLLAAGASGICVAKLSEAEVMLDAGIDDLLITTEVAGAMNVIRLCGCFEPSVNATVRVVVDSYEGAAAIERSAGRPWQALIDVNIAQNRCGVAPEDALALARRLESFDYLQIVGVQGYEGNLQHVRDSGERRALCDAAMDRLRLAVESLRDDGFAVDIVTTGGTGTAEFCAAHDFVTEVQPGSFMFMDADYLDTGDVDYSPALMALSTVISRPTPDRVVIDAGLKTLSNDSGDARLVDAQGWTYRHGGDEHGILTPTGNGADRRDLRVGDLVRVLPSHIDTTVNLHDYIHPYRDGITTPTWVVAARGKVQ